MMNQSDCRNPMILYLRTEFQNSNIPAVIMKFFFALITFSCCLYYSSTAQLPAEFNHSRYIKELKKERTVKDAEMRTDEHSPITADDKITFKKLFYYRTKVSFRKVATFERFGEAKCFLMKTSTDRLPEYSLYGVVKFRHNGKTYKLNVYQNIELTKKPGFQNYLFLPFTDKTSGNETYGGGRFLDLTETGSDTLIIDFNKAYNPYCAYNHKYSCPIPPEENDLKIRISAGEKMWQK